jgi:hypothetical protein
LCIAIACFDARLKASFVFFQACSPFVRTTTTQIPSNYASESAKNEAARGKNAKKVRDAAATVVAAMTGAK